MFRVVLLAVLAVGSVQADEKVIAAFQSAGIVPKWIPNSPSEGMILEFPSSVDNVNATYGNKLAIADVASEPHTQWALPEDESINYYTVMAIDLDADNSADGTGYLLWLNCNITGDYLGDLDFEYQGPTATNHRIVVLVFHQKEFIEWDESLERENFSVSTYSSKNELTIWGGNFFYTTA